VRGVYRGHSADPNDLMTQVKTKSSVELDQPQMGITSSQVQVHSFICLRIKGSFIYMCLILVVIFYLYLFCIFCTLYFISD